MAGEAKTCQSFFNVPPVPDNLSNLSNWFFAIGAVIAIYLIVKKLL